jgi:hypothetical protein
MSAEFFAHDAVVAREEFSPTAITKTTGELRRLDDVREQQGRQHAVQGRWSVLSSEKLLDRIEHCCRVPNEGKHIVAVELDALGSVDVIGEIATLGRGS